MSNILLFTPDLSYSGHSKEVLHCWQQCQERELSVEVVTLRQTGPVVDILQSQGMSITNLGWRHGLNVGALVRLHQMVKQSRPQQIHIWGHSCLRTVFTACGKKPCPMVVWNPQVTKAKSASWLDWLDVRLLKQADQLVLTNEVQRQYFTGLGFQPEQTALTPPMPHLIEQFSDLPEKKPISVPTGRFIICVGPVTWDKCFLNAIWAFDVFWRVYPDFRLVILGSGDNLTRVRQFSKTLPCQVNVDFIEHQPNLSAWYERANMVWLPALSDSGRHVCSEAMSLGLPVIASDIPPYNEIIQPDTNGFLVPLGKQVGFAKAGHKVLDNPELAYSIRRAARSSVRKATDWDMLLPMTRIQATAAAA